MYAASLYLECGTMLSVANVVGTMLTSIVFGMLHSIVSFVVSPHPVSLNISGWKVTLMWKLYVPTANCNVGVLVT